MELFCTIRSQDNIAALCFPLRLCHGIGIIQHLSAKQAPIHDPVGTSDYTLICLKGNFLRLQSGITVSCKVLKGIKNTAILKDAAFCRAIQFVVPTSGDSK